ncbi:hypothetical protein H2O64_20755 [Kordia sp. YSTF-M3]|uniref:Uncharacterized protein n=1 Tax=Kordia aestuariivivens TaxID=2759037 RepID=A0ABR7QFF9_9FLAO|nr:hypothetical protein [Kordia aestuariivivens]MBC8757116.1 hypothetical protein [Kordia aestuariivivens]
MNIFSKLFGGSNNSKNQVHKHYVLYDSKNVYYLKKMQKTIVFFPDRINTNALSEAQTKHIFTKKFRSLFEFWNYITKSKKWYLEYQANSIEHIGNYIEILAPLIVNSTNELRRKMEFSDIDIYSIAAWDDLLFRYKEKSELVFKESQKLKTFCANCGKERMGFSQRYPKSICHECSPKITDNTGRSVEFFNSPIEGYGCQGYYSGTNQQEKYESDICFIQAKEFIAEEARFGGIVIYLKE